MARDAKQKTAGKLLHSLAARLESHCRSEYGEHRSQLRVTPTDDGFRVHWLLNRDALFVPKDGEYIFSEIYRRLALPDIAPWLISLTLEGHQIAMNGTICWEVEPFAAAAVPFSRLKVFRLESVLSDEWSPASAGSLGSLDGRDGDETTLATRLLDRMPVLEELALPCPPSAESFFQRPPHPLRKLSVYDVDYDSFVSRLAVSPRFPHLEELHLIESCRTDVNRRLPVSNYARLLQSEVLAALRVVTLGQVDVTPKQIPLLRGTRVGRQLCCLTVLPMQPWCGRPIRRAPRETLAALRAICGEPFPPVAVMRQWRTDTVLPLARSMQNTGDFSGMPILADALQEAGCEDAALLDHCRAEGTHVSGCWVIEQLLAER